MLGRSKCYHAASYSRMLSQTRVLPRACSLAPQYGPMELQRSQMLNGIKFAGAKTFGTPMTACTIMFQAGSRFETCDDLGATHFLRVMSSAAGNGCTSFLKMRVLQQRGAFITCTSNRQMIAYTLRCPLEVFAGLKYYLLDTAIRSCYRDWEVSDRRPLIRDDLFQQDPEQRVMDLVQRACWAGTLANSQFCVEGRIDSITSDTLNAYVDRNYLPTRCTVATYGVPFDETMMLAEKISLQKDIPQVQYQVPSRPRAGFECYDTGPGSDTWVALAVPGCGTSDLLSLLKHAILAAACGTGNIVTGQHELDRTPESPIGTDNIYTFYKMFNISYEDIGLFGILVKSKFDSICIGSYAAKKFLFNIGNIDERQVAIGKKRLKLSLTKEHEECGRVSEGLALQLANNVPLDNEKTCLYMIDGIPNEEVISTAKDLVSKRGYMTMAVVGDVSAAPNDKDLLTS